MGYMYEDINEILKFAGVTGFNLNRMSKIAVSLRWSVSSETSEDMIIEACDRLRELTNGSVRCYEFILNCQAFIEHAKKYIYLNTDKPDKLGEVAKPVTMFDNFCDNKHIFSNSYHEAIAEEG